MSTLMVATGAAAVCKPCFKQTGTVSKVVVDHAMGDLICTSCGLVLQSYIIDEGQEWRNFAQEGVSNGMEVNQRVRGGDNQDEGDLFGQLQSTHLTGGKDEVLREAQKKMHKKMSSAISDSDTRSLKFHATKVKTMASKLRLSDNIVGRCTEFLEILSQRNVLGHSHQDPWYYAILYLACREENVGRTIRELVHSGAAERDIPEEMFEKNTLTHVRRLRKALPALRQAQNTYINPEELAPRFVAKLQLSTQVSAPAVHIAKEARKVLTDKSGGPGSESQQSAIIMSAIFILGYLLDLPMKPRLADLSSVAKIPQSVIVEVYEQLRPHVDMLLPQGIASQLQLDQLSDLPHSIRPPPARKPVVPVKSGDQLQDAVRDSR